MASGFHQKCIENTQAYSNSLPAAIAER